MNGNWRCINWTRERWGAGQRAYHELASLGQCKEGKAHVGLSNSIPILAMDLLSDCVMPSDTEQKGDRQGLGLCPGIASRWQFGLNMLLQSWQLVPSQEPKTLFSCLPSI